MNMENDKIIVPEVTSAQLFKLIKHIYPAEKVPVGRLASVFGKSNVTNAAITGESIGVLIRADAVISLTQGGMNLGRALVSKNLDDQRKILKELVLKQPVLDFVYSIIKEKKLMRIKEIGQKIAMQFNKNWKNELSYSRYGANCGDLLASAGLGDYISGIYSVEKINVGSSEGVSVPCVGFNKMIKILGELRAKDKSIDELEPGLKTKKGRLSSELNNCVDLGLIRRSGDVLSITETGRELINPINDGEIKKNLFREALRKSPYVRVVDVVEQNRTVDRKKIGEILSHELKKEAGTATQYDMGKKFANWIEASGNEIGRRKKVIDGSETLSETQKKMTPPKLPGVQYNSFRPVVRGANTASAYTGSQNAIFQIGRLIERIELKSSLNQDISEDVEKLIGVCELEPSFKVYASLLRMHFNIYSETKDFRIIDADLKFVKEKFSD